MLTMSAFDLTIGDLDFENFCNLETTIPQNKPSNHQYSSYNSDYESDEDEDYDDYGNLKIKKQHNGLYEWGFDLTDFNGYNQRGEFDDGALRFKRLIRKFRLTNYSVNEGFTWSNDDNSLILITTNHPINGKSCDDKTEREPGYLGFVGVTCKSAELLGEFLKAFRSCASYIKDEANYREYF